MSSSDSDKGQSEKRDLSSENDDVEKTDTRPISEDGEVERTDSDTPSQDSPATQPQLPEESIPPLPQEAPPDGEDDGWDPIWDESTHAYYFHNRFTQVSQWTNPRVPDAQQPAAPGVGNYDRIPDPSTAPGTTTTTTPPLPTAQPRRPHGGYDPAIHGDYDPTAPYAQNPHHNDPDPATTTNPSSSSSSSAAAAVAATAATQDPSSSSTPYTAAGTFNRFTGKWQAHTITPELHNDENKSKRQMSAFFDVDAAANSHNGKSLKAERSGRKLSKQELKAFKEKRKERKEEKRRAWLRD